MLMMVFTILVNRWLAFGLFFMNTLYLPFRYSSFFLPVGGCDVYEMVG